MNKLNLHVQVNQTSNTLVQHNETSFTHYKCKIVVTRKKLFSFQTGSMVYVCIHMLIYYFSENPKNHEKKMCRESRAHFN